MRGAGALAAGVLTVSAAAGATGLILKDGAPIGSDPGVPGELLPPADPTVVSSSAVQDPDGGPPWAVKVFAGASGQDCVRVGRLRGGVLGQIRGSSFRPLPAASPGLCGDLSAEHLLVTVERRAAPPRTLVFGLFDGQGSLTLRIGGSARRLRPATFGAFVFVLPGVQQLDAAVVEGRVDGSLFRRRLG